MTLPDIIGAIVTDVRAEWDASNLKRPFYEYGHPIEIFNKLSEKTQSESFKFDKYPLIAFYLDYEEDITKFKTIFQGLTIVIMTETDRNYEAPGRYSNTFTPTLIPIYKLFLKHLYRSKYVSSEDDENLYTHKKIDRLYYGKLDTFGNSGNIGNDALDAVVISGLNLRLINCK